MFEQYLKEWKPTGEIYKSGGIGVDQPKRHFPITERENMLRALRKEKPMYINTSIDTTRFSPRIIPDNVVRHWTIEGKPIEFDKDEITVGKDMFGAEWEFVPVTGGSMVRGEGDEVIIKDIAHWEDYVTIPDFDSWDWEGSIADNKEYLENSKDRLLKWNFLTGGCNERLIALFGFVNTMLAYVDEDQQPHVHRLFDKIVTLYDDLIDRFKKSYDVNIMMPNDDWGTQRAPQFSNDVAREMLVPYLKRIGESCHKRDIFLELHCCGKNDRLAPVIAEAGVDTWVPQEINDMEIIFNAIGDKVLLGALTPGEKIEMTDEECWAGAKAFMEKYYYPSNGHIIYNAGYAATTNPKMKEYLYCLSREFYDA